LKGIDAKDNENLPEEKEFFDGTECITFSCTQLADLLDKVAFNKDGCITSVEEATLFLQLRLEIGWKLLGLEVHVKKSNVSPMTTLFTEFVPSQRNSASVFIGIQKKIAKNNFDGISLIFMKNFLPE